MESTGSEQEQAALTLGAGGWQTFWRVTLRPLNGPHLRDYPLYARAMGVRCRLRRVRHIEGMTDTMPLRVEKLYNEYKSASAFAIASCLLCSRSLTLGIKNPPRMEAARAYERAQRADAVPEPTRRSFHELAIGPNPPAGAFP